ncbi:PP2C family protein-serine/threonine phosphatase [Caldithrix abyssi]
MERIYNQSFEVFCHSLKGPGKRRCGDAAKTLWLKKQGWLICALADGVSAYPCDWKASSLSCDVALEFIKMNTDMKNTPFEWLERAVEAAHQRLILEKGSCENMMAAISLVAWPIDSDHIFYVNIGDTRIYLLQDEALKQCSRDDVDFVRITQQGKQQFDKKGIIKTGRGVTKSVGQTPPLHFKADQLHFPAGSSLFLCSDGAHGHGSFDGIWQEAIRECKLGDRLSYLVDDAGQSTDDDSSVIIIRRRDWPENKITIYENLPQTLIPPEKEKLIPYLALHRMILAIQESILAGKHTLAHNYLDYLEQNKLYPDKADVIRLMDAVVQSNKPDASMINKLRILAYKA